MKKSILNLFDSTKKENNERLKYFKSNVYNAIPHLKHPEENSQMFKEDFEEVERCYNSPCLNASFLNKSDDKVIDVFKEYCIENNQSNIDWQKVKEIVEDVEKIIKKLKEEHKRPRPFNYFSADNNLSEKYKKSYSYPSGHTTIAYFVCDLLSHHIPSIRQDCQTLASIIGQSRLDNGVHFPSDVSYGRLVGETLSDIYCNEDMSNIKENKKSFVNFILTDLNNKESFNLIKEQITEFLYLSTKNNYSICSDASGYLLSNYPINYITEDTTIKSAVNCVNAAFNLGNINSMSKLIELHKSIDHNMFISSDPGELNNSINFSNIREDIDYILKNGNIYQKHKMLSELKIFKEHNDIVKRVVVLSESDYDFRKANTVLKG